MLRQQSVSDAPEASMSPIVKAEMARLARFVSWYRFGTFCAVCVCLAWVLLAYGKLAAGSTRLHCRPKLRVVRHMNGGARDLCPVLA